MKWRVRLIYTLNYYLVADSPHSKGLKCSKDYDEPHTNVLPAHEASPKDTHFFKLISWSSLSVRASLSSNLSGCLWILSSEGNFIEVVDELEKTFLLARKELFLFYLLDTFCHVILISVFRLEILVNFFHLLRRAVELECNNPGRPLSWHPVYEIKEAHDYNRPDGVKVLGSFPPRCLMDRIDDSRYCN